MNTYTITSPVVNSYLLKFLMKTFHRSVLNVKNSFKIAAEELSPFGVEVIAHDVAWIKEKKMGSFLSVTKATDEPPVFLEMIYHPKNASNAKPVALVGTDSFFLILFIIR